jgi:hypothetical protein
VVPLPTDEPLTIELPPRLRASLCEAADSCCWEDDEKKLAPSEPWLLAASMEPSAQLAGAAATA